MTLKSAVVENKGLTAIVRQTARLGHVARLATELPQLGFARASGQRILWVTGKFNEFALSVGVENAQRIYSLEGIGK